MIKYLKIIFIFVSLCFTNCNQSNNDLEQNSANQDKSLLSKEFETKNKTTVVIEIQPFDAISDSIVKYVYRELSKNIPNFKHLKPLHCKGFLFLGKT